MMIPPVVPLVSRAFCVPAHQILATQRGRANVSLARQVSMYLTHTVFGLRVEDVGNLFERERSTVLHAVARIEDRRDEQEFDKKLTQIEREILDLESNMAWTEDQVSQLLELIPTGQSMSTMAGKLGKTRNAVIGKVHRLAIAGDLSHLPGCDIEKWPDEDLIAILDANRDDELTDFCKARGFSLPVAKGFVVKIKRETDESEKVAA